jgi:glycine/D-amino acid oxidase-like deaminating enzyme
MFAGVGWRGAGDKFAPRVGRVLAQLALQPSTGYDIRRFAPARFAGGREAGGLKTGGAVS